MVRMITPISQSMSFSEYGDASAEISIAREYEGPPVDHSIPWAAPLDFYLIPTAEAAAPSSTSLSSFPVPVVQPIAGSSKKISMEVNLGFGTDKFTGKGRASSVESDDGSRNRLNVIGGHVGMSTVVSSSNSDSELVRRALDETQSSGTVGFLDSRDHSQELSGSSDVAETALDSEVVQGVQRFMDPENWNSAELSSTPQAFAVEVSSSCEEVSDEEGLQRRTRRANANFVEPELDEKVDGEDDGDEEEQEEGEGRIEIDSVRSRMPNRVVKKGVCFQCLKGHLFSEKEVCIVCDAKYCCNCVLIAMGSMPEGRKCLGCIGYPINESKRRSLGKCSRMLRGLLDKDEVLQIMHSEVSCPVNHILPVYVNGKPLNEEELNLLQSCPVPPRKLKPGRYWYDKVSGFWGKERHKPCQVISHSLEVGNPIRRDASNGDTDLLINGREITKAELWMLKSAGVQCAGISSLWLMPDGSYQEEGMNFVKGKKIWGRKRTKILCTFLSLPTPGSPNLHRETTSSNGERVVSVIPDYRPLYKILLLGNDDKSGVSTIFKQARFRYNVPFSAEEVLDMKYMIQRKLFGYLAVLLEGREYFEEECLVEMRRQAADKPGPSNYISEELEKNMYSLHSKLRLFSDWLIHVVVSGNLESIFPAAARDYASDIEALLKDPAIQATFNRRDKLGLTMEANYFLDKAVEIAKDDYEPSDTDIMYAEGVCSSNGVSQVEFTFPGTPEDDCFDDSGEQPKAVSRQVIVHPKNIHRTCLMPTCNSASKIHWRTMQVAGEDEVDTNGDPVNKMMASKKLFENVVKHSTFSNTSFLLILNKIDILGKVEQVSLNQCEWFNDFTMVPSRHQRSRRNNTNDISPQVQRAFHYVALKFKRLYKLLTGRNLYVWPASALEPDSVDGAMIYAREIIRWEQEKINLNLSFNQMSTEIVDASSS
ncbi:hypothetical protein V2J09_016595 [Rumex salicifolius]